MKIWWIFFWRGGGWGGGGGGHPQIGLVLGVITMFFRVFLKVHINNRDFLGVAKISNIFLGP